MLRNIALVTGGYSGEAEISYQTAQTIYNNLCHDTNKIYLIDIGNDGWFYMDGDTRIAVDRLDFSIEVNAQKIMFDAVYIALHGTPGEDGKLQGYFDLLNIPYTSCDCAISAITFNKRYTVAVAKMSGVAVANSVLLFKHTPIELHKINSTLSYPVFVKPNNGGSSIGMSKVANPEMLEEAIQKAFKEDSQVLIEEMIQGREFTIGVYKSKDGIKALPITEIIVSGEQAFFDYEAKYKGKSQEITPAIIDESIRQKIENEAIKIYNIFNCRGVVRIDFILEPTTLTPHMLEINTIPGQSEASIIPQQIKAAGLSLKEVYTALLEQCF